MEIYTIKKPDSIKKRRRVGCGPSSGSGKTCGRGHNGQLSRSGSGKRPWFEGGQMPLQRRVPKRGFTNIFKKEFQIVNLSQIEKLNIDSVDPEVLEQKNVINKSKKMVKVLGNGDLSKSVKVVADAFSRSAIEKIKKAGGEAVIREVSNEKEEK
ncbi:MAG: 50S ribosomal protein L15 [bacterium]|nr:50S ribosomal protein L15 [bacterium]